MLSTLFLSVHTPARFAIIQLNFGVVLAHHGLFERRTSPEMMMIHVFGGLYPGSGLARHSQGICPRVSQPVVQLPYIFLYRQNLRTCLQSWNHKKSRAVCCGNPPFKNPAPHTHYSSARAARVHNQTTGCYDQAPAMNWDLAVSWRKGVWVISVSDSVSDSVRVGLAKRN